jgi:hypothetical protein
MPMPAIRFSQVLDEDASEIYSAPAHSIAAIFVICLFVMHQFRTSNKAHRQFILKSCFSLLLMQA